MDPSLASRVYLDNAATSWPKPASVVAAMEDYYTNHGASAGRGSYRSGLNSSQLVETCRVALAKLINTKATNIAFTCSGTDALNTALMGYLREGDHVVTTAIEHNSVLRPLKYLERSRGITFTVVPCDRFGFVEPVDVKAACEGSTRLIVVSHASNVTGAIQDVSAICDVATNLGVATLLDAAQSLGHSALDLVNNPVSMVACSGHKGLMGPLGTGFLYVSEALHTMVDPFRFGGTGTDSMDLEMPKDLPHRLEAGNINVAALAGLCSALDWLAGESNDSSLELADLLASELEGISDLIVLRQSNRPYVPVVSVIPAVMDPHDVAIVLDSQFGIEVRAGLHCSPLIHDHLGSHQGTLRFSLGRFTTHEDVKRAAKAMCEISTQQEQIL